MSVVGGWAPVIAGHCVCGQDILRHLDLEKRSAEECVCLR
jgi:hypothetical protein